MQLKTSEMKKILRFYKQKSQMQVAQIVQTITDVLKELTHVLT